MTTTGVEDRIIDDGGRMDPQSGGVAVDAVAVQRVQAFLFDALHDQPSNSRPEQSVEQSHRRLRSSRYHRHFITRWSTSW
jgi:hypothetical protein